MYSLFVVVFVFLVLVFHKELEVVFIFQVVAPRLIVHWRTGGSGKVLSRRELVPSKSEQEDIPSWSFTNRTSMSAPAYLKGVQKQTNRSVQCVSHENDKSFIISFP